jgi:Family of unknown function (DUF6491)
MNFNRAVSRAVVCGLTLAATSVLYAGDRATTAAKTAQTEVSIPFANHGGIRTWSVLDDRTLLIEDSHGHWYRAELMSAAFDLSFAEALAFKTTPSGSFDRFSTVIVKGRAYPLVSLTRAGPPAKKKK